MRSDIWTALYIGAFAAHDRAYVKDSRMTLKEPLTPDVVSAAFGVGGFSVSGYLASPHEDGFTTHVGAIDFDSDDGFDFAVEVREVLDAQGVGSLLVGSRRGAHLWCISTHVMPAPVMRRALKNAVTLIDRDSEKVEVFPKRSKSSLGVGALRMPLMRHPKTGIHYPAYDPADDHELTTIEAVVTASVDVTTPSDGLRRLAGPDAGDVSYPRWNPLMGLSRRVTGDEPKVTDLLAGYGMDVTPGRSVRCPFHDDAHASLQVAPDDERAWCKAPHCPLYNDGRGLGSLELAKHIRKEPSGDTSNPPHPQRLRSVLP